MGTPGSQQEASVAAMSRWAPGCKDLAGGAVWGLVTKAPVPQQPNCSTEAVQSTPDSLLWPVIFLSSRAASLCSSSFRCYIQSLLGVTTHHSRSQAQQLPSFPQNVAFCRGHITPSGSSPADQVSHGLHSDPLSHRVHLRRIVGPGRSSTPSKLGKSATS